MAPKTPQRHLESMHLLLQVWLYIKPEQHAHVSCHMASVFEHLLKAPWTANASPIYDEKNVATSKAVHPEREKIGQESLDEKNPKDATVVHLEWAKVDSSSLDEGDVFSCIEIDLRTTQRIVSPEKRAEAFSNILERIIMGFRRHSFSHITGLDSKSKRILAWELQDSTSSPGAFKPDTDPIAVWFLKPPVKNGKEKAAGNIEVELYKLANIKQRSPPTSFLKPVEAHSALKGLETCLHAYNLLYEQLGEKQTILESADLEEGSIGQHINEYVKILERLDQALSGVIAIYDNSTGRRNFSADFIAQRERHGFAAFGLRLLRSIGIHKYGTIKIKDKHFEELKDGAREKLRRLQRLAPILAAHARLQQSETGQKLKQVCDLASEGPEKLEFTTKMGIQPANLNNKEARIASLVMVRENYETRRKKLLVQVETLDRYIAKKVTEKGPKIFRRRPTFKSLMSDLFQPVELRRQEYRHCVKSCDRLTLYHNMGWPGKICYDKKADEMIYHGKKSCEESSCYSSDGRD